MSINIINRALMKIGEMPIASVNQAPLGSILARMYEDGRRSLLSTHYWRFAIKRARLVKLDEDTGSSLFNYAYALPSDYLVLKDFDEMYKLPNINDINLVDDSRYSIEGNRILTKSDTPVNITYIADVSDTNLFPALFKEALISWIAAEISVRVKNGAEYKQLSIAEFDRYIAQAINNNEIVRDTESLPDNSWVSCRDNWGVDFYG